MNEKRQTILVVDDIPDDIVILEEILKKDYQVKAVTSGEAALKIARGDNPPDLILLDVIMPEMDGFEVCRRLKQDSAGATIPVIFLTAKVKSSDESFGFQLGAVDYIRKPVEPDIVLKRDKAHLDTKDEAMRSSEVRFRRLFETAKAGIMIADASTGKIIDINPSLAGMLGCTQESFLGASLWDLEYLRDIVGDMAGSATSVRGEYVRHTDKPLETPGGQEQALRPDMLIPTR